MDKPDIVVLYELENYLTLSNINILKDRFIKNIVWNEFEGADPNVQNIDTNIGVINIYDSQENDIIQIKFENLLTKNLLQITSTAIYNIDSILIQIEEGKKTSFINYLKSTLNKIEKQKKLFEIFPVCSNPIRKIKEHLQQKYSINLSEKIAKKSPYTLKGDVRPNIFSKIYTLCFENEIIDEQEIEQETFTSVFKDRETSNTIQFTCSTALAVGFLETIKELFIDFTAKTVEKSQRFITKNGKPITESNYNTSKGRISPKDQEILTAFPSEFNELIG